MQQRTLLPSKALSKTLAKALLILSLVGCTTGQSTKKDFSAPPLDKVFSESYDVVWKAIGLATVKYQMKLSDYDSGVYETQPIRSDKARVS